jgi:hypothetical protein
LKFLPLTDHRTYDQQYDPLWESSSLLLLPGEEANLKPHSTVLGGTDSIVQGATRQDRAGVTTSSSRFGTHIARMPYGSPPIRRMERSIQMAASPHTRTCKAWTSSRYGTEGRALRR